MILLLSHEEQADFAEGPMKKNPDPSHLLTWLAMIVIAIGAPVLLIEIILGLAPVRKAFPHLPQGDGIDMLGLVIILGLCSGWLKAERPLTWPTFLAITGSMTMLIGSIFPLGGASLAIGGAGLWILLLALLKWEISRASKNRPGRYLGAFLLLYVNNAYFLAASVFVANSGSLPFHAVFGENPWLWIASLVLLLPVPLCLFMLPERLHHAKPPTDKEHASEQRAFTVAAYTVIAVAAMAGDLFLQHFFRGPLASLDPDRLAATLIGVILTLAPLYAAIVGSVMRYGLDDLINPAIWLGRWLRLAAEHIKVLRNPQGEPGPGEQSTGRTFGAGPENTA